MYKGFATKEGTEGFFRKNGSVSPKSVKECDYFLLSSLGIGTYKPLNDEEILENVQKRFGLKMVRRSITKYRLELKIPSSKERKKEYALSC